MAASDARGAVAWRARVVRAARLLFLAVGMACCFSLNLNLNLNLAGAAAYSVLRAAAAFAVRQYIVVLTNGIVLVLLELFLRDDEAFSFSAAAFFGGWWPSESDGDAQDWCLPLPPGPPMMLLLPAPAAEEEVFEDKQAVHVTTVRAKPPRRSRSAKAAARRRRAAAAALEQLLRRAESENGRQRAEPEPEVPPVEWGMDEEAFQRYIEAYILKQQAQFLFEESAAAAKAAGGGGSRGGGEVIGG
ncbi:unnamed protein product [Urochloa humidicola]